MNSVCLIKNWCDFCFACIITAFLTSCGSNPEQPNLAPTSPSIHSSPTQSDSKVALDVNPDVRQRINTLLGNDQTEEAIALCQAAIGESPDRFELRQFYIEILIRQFDFETATKEIKACMGANIGDQSYLYTCLGRTELAKDNAQQAILAFTKAIECSEEGEEPFELRGDAYMRAQQFELARDDYSTEIANEFQGMAPPTLIIKRIDSLIAVGDISSALDDAHQVVRVTPRDPRAEAVLALLIASTPNDDARNGEQALEIARAAETAWKDKSEGKSMRIEIALAAAYAELGDFKNAVFHQNIAIDSSNEKPSSPMLEQLNCYKSSRPFRFNPAGIKQMREIN